MRSFSFRKTLKYISFVVAGLFLPVHFASAGVGDSFTLAIVTILGLVAAAIESLAHAIMVGGAYLMQLSVDELVLGMPQYINDWGGINIGWNTLSNVANMFFIFGLLFIAFATILGFSSYKKQIIPIIIAALLINFSLVFTKLAIDVSNVTAIGFYNATFDFIHSDKSTVKEVQVNWYCIKDCDMEPSGLGSFIAAKLDPKKIHFDTPPPAEAKDTSFSLTESIFGAAFPLIGGILAINKLLGNDTAVMAATAVQNLVTNILSIFFYSISAFVFFNAAIIFISRFIILIFLLILSPLAFASYPLPKLKSLVFDKWADALTAQLVVAPVFMFFLYITIIIINGIDFSKGTGTMTTLLNFMVIIGFMIFTLQATEGVAGSVGSGIRGKIKGKVKGYAAAGAAVGGAYAGRKTIGNIGQKIAGSERVSSWVANKDSKFAQFAGNNAMRLGNTMHEAKFGGKESLKSSQEAKSKRIGEQGVQAHGNIIQKAKEAEGLGNIKRSEELKLQAKEMHKSFETMSKKPGAGIVGKGYGTAFKEIEKKKTVEAAKEAAEKTKGADFEAAEKAGTNIQKALDGNDMTAMVKEINTLNKNQLKLLKATVANDPRVLAGMSSHLSGELLKNSSADVRNAVKDILVAAKHDPSHYAYGNAKELLRQNGPNQTSNQNSNQTNTI